MAVAIRIVDHTGNVSRQAKLAENAEIRRLIPAIVTTLSLPITDPAGRPITYHLSYNDRALQEDETLESAGVQTGQTVTIVPEMTAGNGSIQSSTNFLEHQQPLVHLSKKPAQIKKPIKGFPENDRSKIPGLAPLSVLIRPAAIDAIYKHTGENLEKEAGGLLVGEVYEEDHRLFVVVDTVYPAFFTEADHFHVTFTKNTWIDLLARRRVTQAQKTVGWYHSHPGFGVFFSSQDAFTHRSFFGSQFWYIGLVVDPRKNEMGAFSWDGAKIVTSQIVDLSPNQQVA
jgi:proteasome lid subunit RPN8/RPN11